MSYPLALQRDKNSKTAKLIGTFDISDLAKFGTIERDLVHVKTPLGVVTVRLTPGPTHVTAEIVSKPFLISYNQIWSQVESHLT